MGSTRRTDPLLDATAAGEALVHHIQNAQREAGCWYCPQPAARPPSARLLLSCLQHPGAWLAAAAMNSGVERLRAPCAPSAQCRSRSVAPPMLAPSPMQEIAEG